MSYLTNPYRYAGGAGLDVPPEDCHNMTLNTSDQLLGSGCWQFDGSTSYVDFTDTLIRSGAWESGTSAFSLSYWFRTGTYNYVTCSQQCLTSAETEGDWLNSYPTYATSMGVNLGTTYHNDVWHLIVMRWDNSDMIASIDTSGTTATAGVNLTPPTWNTTTSTMALGGKFNSPNCVTGVTGVIRSAYVFDGEIDEMGIWNRTLTNGEVDALYNGGSGATVDSISTADLLAYYNFEQAVAEGLLDQS